MALIPVKNVTLAGLLDAAPVAAADPDTFENQGQVIYMIDNTDGSPTTATFASERDCNQGFDHDIVGIVAAGDVGFFGPFPVTRFGTVVSVSLSNITGQFVMPLRISV